MDTNKTLRLEQVFLAGIDAQAALGGLVQALDAGGVDNPELRGYLGTLAEKLAYIGETVTGAVGRPTEEISQ